MSLNIKLENFEGPFDLLLHLVEKNKFNIYELNISQIIEEYIIVIREAELNRLQVKVEFLEVASELLEIKSLAILNKKEKEEKEELLGQRILEYKRFKEISEELQKLEKEYNISFTKKGVPVRRIISEDFDMSSLNMIEIAKAYKRLFEEEEKQILRIDLDEKYSLEEGMTDIRKALNNRDEVDFGELLGSNFTKLRIVIIFLGILELFRNNEIDIFQNGKIFIKKRGA